jgi:hypothetical protein
MEAKRREVTQLLREYRAYWSAFGGSTTMDEAQNMRGQAKSYGPAGYIEKGRYYLEYPKAYLDALHQSYEELEKAKRRVTRRPKGMYAFLLLQDVYFGDPADWRIAQRWDEAKPRDYRSPIHQVFVGWLAQELRDVELHPIWPTPYSESEQATSARQNAEIYATYQRVRTSGSPHHLSVAQTALYFSQNGASLSSDAVERIIEFRDTLKLPTCAESGCDRAPQRGTLCMRHYMQARRRAKRGGRTQRQAG